MRFFKAESRLSIFLAMAVFISSFIHTQSVAQDIPEHRSDKEKSASSTEEDNSIKWERHESITGSYETKFPIEHKYNVFPFQYNDTNVAFSAEIFSQIDEEEDSEESGKTAFIRSIHTFGSEMSLRRAESVLKKAEDRYLQIAKNLKGTIIENKEIDHNGFIGRSIYITYKEPEKTDKTALRVKLYMTNYALVEQVVTGPAMSMYSYRVDDFFKSIKLSDGIKKSDLAVGTGWIPVQSKNNVFTIKVPPKNKDYTPYAPNRQSSKLKDRIIYKVKDPLMDVDLHYIVTSYKVSSRLTDESVKEVVSRHHLSKFLGKKANPKIATKVTDKDGLKTYEMSVVVSPIRQLPYITHLNYEVQIKNNHILVKEFLSGIYHKNSGLDKTFFKLTQFHPESYSFTPSTQKGTVKNGDKKGTSKE